MIAIGVLTALQLHRQPLKLTSFSCRNYGRLSNYFLPRQIDCVPPPDWVNMELTVTIGSPGWKTASRVRFNRYDLSGLDDWCRDEYLASGASQQGMGELEVWAAAGQADFRAILPEGRSLPAPLESIFMDLSIVMQEYWSRLQPGILDEVELAKRSAGLDIEPNLVDRRTAMRATYGSRLRELFQRQPKRVQRGPVIG